MFYVSFVFQNIAALDFSSLSCSKVDVSLLFSSLWELMSCANAPHWNCVSVLMSAVKDPAYQKLLANTYRFMPILADLLIKSNISLEDKLKLLNLMEVCIFFYFFIYVLYYIVDFLLSVFTGTKHGH